MKKMKKIAGLLLAMVMVLAMTASVFAATVVDNKTEGHKYAAYQVFSGTQSGDANDTSLGDIVWGTGITEAGQTALQTEYEVSSAAELATKLTDETTAKAFAKELVSYLSDTKTEIAADAESVNVTPGYYLIVDTTEFNEGDTNTWKNLALLQVTGNTLEIRKKNDIPSVEKKVKENSNKYNTDGGYGAGYNDVADYNIGDQVPFELIGTLPTALVEYDTYSYTFHDTLSAGLTYDVNSVVVKVNGVTEVDSSKYTVTYKDNQLTVAFTNIKDVTITITDKIYVNYTATLNKNAVIGLNGNENEVYLEYSNNPNEDGTGKTQTDKVIVFTYELDVTKVDGQDATKKLKDAEFVLKNSSGKFYKKTEDTTTGSVTIAWVDSQDDATVLKSDTAGEFKVVGLDDGTYRLKETKAPAGYNLLTEDVSLTITATTGNGQNWSGEANAALTKLQITSGNTTADGNISTGAVSLTVQNNKGASLPETGGIGTTIFYVIGTILVLGAAVLLVTKRRMNAQK